MAYAVAVTYRRKENGALSIVVVETDAAAASETPKIKVPKAGRIRRVTGRVDTGVSTGTTIDTRIGRAPGWTANTEEEIAGDNSSLPAASFSDITEVPYYSPDGAMYLRSTVDAGTDNRIIHEIEVIQEPGVY